MQIGNDDLSSMQIPNGLKVTIYENDNFGGRSKTFTSSVACLETGWNDNASSVVVETTTVNNPYQNEFVTFYNDCYSSGYSQSLAPGVYTGSQLGSLKYNISSFTITGNLRVKVYVNNENATGYSTVFEQSQGCLSSTHNDKIGSVVIEYKTTTSPDYGSASTYVNLYVDCNYKGNSLRLQPGYYEGEKLGLMKYSISSIEVPANLVVRAFIYDENLQGNPTTITQSNTCLGTSTNDKIGSLIIETRGGNINNPPPSGNDQRVVIYSDENYKGLSSSLLPGTYATMAQAGFIDDALSSLSVPPGYRVVLYEFENFRGKSYTITQSKPGFLISGWNDKASSIAVYKQ